MTYSFTPKFFDKVLINKDFLNILMSISNLRGRLYKINEFTYRPSQKSNRSFKWFHKINNFIN